MSGWNKLVFTSGSVALWKVTRTEEQVDAGDFNAEGAEKTIRRPRSRRTIGDGSTF